MSYLREVLAGLEHDQWDLWSDSVIELLQEIKSLAEQNKHEEIIKKINEKITKWNKCKVRYQDLPEKEKEKDRVWADKVLEELSKYFNILIGW